MMEEENGLFACDLDVLVGYTDWSEVPDEWPEEPEAGAVDTAAETLMAAPAECRIVFNHPGPGNLRRMQKVTVESSDGHDMDVDRLYTWAPAPDQVGHSLADVEEFLTFKFRNSKSWMAAGIALRRVRFEEAQCIVKYVAGPLACAGLPSVAGCTDGPDGQRMIRMVAGTFGNHKGLMHELAHAFGHAGHNKQFFNDGSCPSVMGGPPDIWPTASDISSTRRWAHS